MSEYSDIYEEAVQIDADTDDSTNPIDTVDSEEVSIELTETFPLLGTNNPELNHAQMNNREISDQHPITAITGLKESLDEIRKLKSVYSDKANVANFYEWKDAAYDEYGYFVSLVPGTSTIKICDGDDIFGVSVSQAGFIGGQDEDVPRDNSYGLIVTSGIVDVRCESDVKVGDYVVSNTSGWAEKSDSNYGYRVIARESKHGIEYAVIVLGVQADVTNNLGEELTSVAGRVRANEINIVSAINVANQAYNKATEVGTSNQEMSDKVDDALGVVDKVVSDVENLETQVSNSALISAQAKAIAESAAVSAESMRNEAVVEANKALVETSDLRKEFEEKVVEIDTELDNTVLELQETKEGFDATINDLRLDTEGQLADFKKEVSENYATTTQLAAVKTETSDAIAAVKQEASDTYATIESVVALQTETSESIAGFKQEVSETYATQEMLTSLETDTGKALTDYKQEVTETYATQEMVSKLETDTTKALTDYKQEVADTYATQEMVTKLETDSSKALSDYKQEVGDTYATQTSLNNLRTDTTNAIAASEEKATATYASKSDLTSFESNTNLAMARIEQKADVNGAYIQSTVSNMDKYSVGPYSQAYGFTRKQAQSVLEVGMIYVPTEDGLTEEYVGEDELPAYSREFLQGYLYRWGEVSDGYGWITVDKDYSEDKLNTSAPAVYFSTTIAPSVADINDFGYWYTNGDTLAGTAEGYEPYTLYKWCTYATKDENGAVITSGCWNPVATLAGNSSNRAVSQIRQDANSIEMRVTNTEGSATFSKQWIDDNSANIQDVVSWKSDNGDSLVTFMQTADDNYASASQVAQIVDKDGNVNAASIVTAVNDAGSSVVIDADHINFEAENYTIHADKINFEGSQFSSKMSQTYSTKEETEDAKESAINSANSSTDEKLKNYSTTAQTQSLIDQKADSITVSVSETYSTKDELAEVSDRVTETEASIKINTDDINLKVSKDGVISSINTSAEGITINSSRINLNGYVTVAGLSGGTTTINGACVKTGVIKSKDYGYITGRDFSTNGTAINLDSGNIISENFSVIDGNAKFKGIITADSGSSLGGFSVNENSLTFSYTENGYLYTSGFGVGSNDDPYLLWVRSVDTSTDLPSFSVTREGKVISKSFQADEALVFDKIRIFGGASNFYSVYSEIQGMNLYLGVQSGDDPADCACELSPRVGLVFRSDTREYSDEGEVVSGGFELVGSLVPDYNSKNVSPFGDYKINDANSLLLTPDTNGYFVIEGNNYYSPNSMETVYQYFGRYGYSLSNGKHTPNHESALIRFYVNGNTKIAAFNMPVDFNSTVDLSSANVINSARCLKSNIQSLPENTSILFDNLIPRSFTYNDGTSNRTHYGLIVDELRSAMDIAEITPQECAAYCLDDINNPDGKGGIRYEELVPILIAEVQKLKKRVVELENN